MSRRSFESVQYLATVALITVAVAGVAWWVRDGTLGFSAAILGLYVLHLLSIRFILHNQQEQRATLDEHWELLQQLVGRTELAGGRAGTPVAGASDRRLVGISGDAEAIAGTGRLYAGETTREAPVPRHLAIGTVAIVRRMLEPADVAQIILEQRKRPDRRFGETALLLGLLTESQLEELLVAQQEGLFTDDEIEEARRRLEEFRHSCAPTAVD
ncbi:MAG: hypothetical protein ACE5JR_10060 [Gemmatimonadota bacterium]